MEQKIPGLVQTTGLEGAYIIKPIVHGDHRGWFTETYSYRDLEAYGIKVNFMQDNQSMTAQKGTLRGLHFQNDPKSQTKLIRCTKGAILDVIVDIRKGSPQFGKHFKVELSAENKCQLYIPKGFAHGFVTLTDDVEVQYKVDEYYSLEQDRSIRFDDPLFGIDWGISDPILSAKDKDAPLLKDSDCNFIY